MHEAMAATLDTAVEQIKNIQQDARVHGNTTRPRWPMIVFNSPKGWTGPKIVDGLQVEGTFRAHQVPVSDPATHPEHLKLLEEWLRSYRPEELFDEQGRLKPELAEWDYGDYEGQRSVDIRQGRPDWSIFRDGCPHGETPAQVADRADRLIKHFRTLDENVAIFSHGQFGSVLAARWIGLPVSEAQHFQLSTASLSVLGNATHHPEVPVITMWNATANDRVDSGSSQRAGSATTMTEQAIERWENEGGRKVMTIHPMAGQPAPPDMLIDVAQLERAYYERRPEFSDPNQRVLFGTSGHRGTSSDGTFTEAHILAITQAVCDYRQSQGIDGPILVGKDTHALSRPTQRTALEVLAGNGVEALIAAGDGVTPVPVISRAVLTYNRARREHLADALIATPSHNPPGDGGFKYNPPNGGPADTDVTSWIQQRANDLLEAGNREVRRVPYAAAIKADTTHETDFITPYVRDLNLVIDMQAIRDAKLKLGVDPLGGASLFCWEPINSLYGLDIQVVNSKVDPTFSFMTVDHDGQIRMDCSSPYAMANLVRLKDRFQVAFGNDPDSDRHGIVTPSTGLMNPNHYLAGKRLQDLCRELQDSWAPGRHHATAPRHCQPSAETVNYTKVVRNQSTMAQARVRRLAGTREFPRRLFCRVAEVKSNGYHRKCQNLIREHTERVNSTQQQVNHEIRSVDTTVLAALHGIGRPTHQEGRTLMTRHNIPLGRILGIPIGLDYSWFVIFALLTWMLAGSYYPAEFKDWPPLLYWFMGAVTAIMLFVSVLLHELGHSVVALRYKFRCAALRFSSSAVSLRLGRNRPAPSPSFLLRSRARS